jgi:hypothetical protein
MLKNPKTMTEQYKQSCNTLQLPEPDRDVIRVLAIRVASVLVVGFAHNGFDAFAAWCDGASPLLAPSGSVQPQGAQQKN